MGEREVIERIQALDRALAGRGMPSEASERVRQHLAREATGRRFQARMRWWPVLAFAAGAALMAVLLIEGPSHPIAERDDTGADIEPLPDLAVETPTIVAQDCDAFDPGSHRLEAGDCVQADGIEVSALIPSTIEREGDRVQVSEGEVVFEVESRAEHPLHVIAGTTDIEVVGTRFVVYQRAGEGWISMLEGRVRVREGEGAGVMLERGQRLEWSAVSEAEAEAIEAAPTRREVEVKPADQGLAELLDEVATLRRAGQFADAVDRLRDADPRGWTERSRQLVSYEIGTLLERQLRDSEAACEHWLAHRERFPDGRHDEIVARSITRLGCDEP
jgi:hypothetical protein